MMETGGFVLIVSAPIRIKRVRPGDDTETYCGRCKAERTHQVVALNADGVPATVICRTCGGQHRFHSRKEATAHRPPGSARAVRKPAEHVRDAPAGPARPYSPKEVYAAGEWVEHPKFGQGKVTQARAGKIEVRFESGNRLLLHAG
jgi:RNase P subunit RPR2